jgi:hypothetical protein
MASSIFTFALIPFVLIGFVGLVGLVILIALVRVIFGGGQSQEVSAENDPRIFDTNNAILADAVIATSVVESYTSGDDGSSRIPTKTTAIYMPDAVNTPVEAYSYAPDPATTPVEASYSSTTDSFSSSPDTSSSFSSGCDSSSSCSCDSGS